MGDRLRRGLLSVAMLVLAGVITIGLATAPPSDQDRADVLAEQLRCPVCQGESVADSPSDTATAIRLQIDHMVTAGRTDTEILDHYVERYGRRVLLDPPPRGDTLLLWLLPVAALVAGLGVVATRRRTGPARHLTDQERAQLRQHLTALHEGEGES